MTAHIRRLFDHLVWADARTLHSLRAMHAAPLDALRLYGHVLAAEHVWLARIEDREPEMPVWPALDLDECAALSAKNHAAFALLAETLSTADLERKVHYRNSKGDEFTNTVEDILTHVALHGSYHRGQVARIVRAEGGSPQATDYIFFIRERP
ncbi:MAG: DinB family protein [Gemmatimonadales bacterium]|jgi:uncharacterized damage-inducible protein DinB